MTTEPQAAANPDHSNEHRVLVLPSTRADALAIGKLFELHGLGFRVCEGLRQLCDLQCEGAGSVIIAEEALAADSSELIECVTAQPVWSDLPIIVLSRTGRESSTLGGILERLGNVSVIERPVRTSTLISLVRSSLRARERQYEVRRHLAEQLTAQRMVRESVDAERAARSEAERAGRIKDEFLATLSHELRTPLNAILGWTQVMRRSRNLAVDAPNALDVIDRNARAQAQIIHDLLDMSSIISGKVRLNMEAVDLRSIVATTIETVRLAAEAKGVILDADLQAGAPSVRGDQNRLQQVLWNLLTNAVKFTAKDGRVQVTLARSDSHVVLVVADEGEGIAPEFLPQVFDRFRQADASSTRRHGGLGLGLSIAKQLVEMHGGEISAASPGKGQGATFRMSLPAMSGSESLGESRIDPQEIAASIVASIPTGHTDTDLDGLKVLVVDDEPDARALVERLLRECNAQVVTAGSASDAVKAVVREKPDMLISDIGMPGEDGYELIRQIRALKNRGEAIPAIALTAYARAEDRAKAIASGFQLHLVKPVEPAQLISEVKRLAVGAR